MGKFIVIEGLDGTGKTTQIKLLGKYLEACGEKVFLTAEPTPFPTGRFIRRVLSGEIPSDPWETAALFLADRIAHNQDKENGIEKHLKEGETVISDRYYYSTFAYQGHETSLPWIMKMHSDCPQIRKPDKVIFLTMSPEKCLRRIKENRPGQALEIYENTESLSRTSEKFDEVFSLLKDSENISYVDADGSIEEVSERIIKALEAENE